MDLSKLEAIVKGTMLVNEPMSRHTSYGIGGPALVFLYPADEEDLAAILQIADTNDIPAYFIGSGTNLLVSDQGYDGFVISLQKTFKEFKICDNHVYAQCGVMMGHFVKECINHNLTGVESLIGIPGTLGGALMMNAGAYGKEISNYLTRLNLMTISGEKKQVARSDISFNYRYSSIKEFEEVILSAEFEFKKGATEEIRILRSQASINRKTTQPLRYRSAGSVFKNPPEKPAGYLIEKAGLKGTRKGDAEISTKHANFFINHGDATAEDVASLIRLTRRTVEKQFGIYLDLEIKTLGFSIDYFEA